ncbi:two-component system response regulator [Pokkaliibacter plantistimulans]|uniref:Two-component system response regulator n=1 Tax=Proteobacteria bacterium 228 TaxID=2083153 RepID=A0A2S5KI48_9PROT|nr:two-component system response regulator [Pokkaliibacter plantistimulans]PPC74450.1 two-component system response regulator [Pokkaliibacter plantistimulans]
MGKATILVVDDNPENIDVLVGALGEGYQLRVALSGEKALQIAQRQALPDIMLLDVMMPGMDGYELCRRLKQDPLTQRIPVMFITARNSSEDEVKGLEAGAVDFISKPINPRIVKARVAAQLALYDQQKSLSQLVQQRTSELQLAQQKIIQYLGKAAEYKDNETGMHVVRMSHYAYLLAHAIGMDEETAQLLKQAAPMHDIGKIGIADHILLKPGKLDATEWAEMQRHVQYGLEIMGDDDSHLLLTLAREIIAHHHEKWDGSGYPQGLRGEEISLAGRIVALADVFDALTSVRPYKPAWSDEDAIGFIRDQSGQHFEPRLVDAFVTLMPQILEVRSRYGD